MQINFPAFGGLDHVCTQRNCYQGLRSRAKKEMSPENARMALDKSVFNPECCIIVTGGEPFNYPRIFEILDSIDERELEFWLLSNGNQLTNEVACDLSSYRHLIGVQLSLDGITEETHAITRTRQNFAKVLAAIDHVGRYRIRIEQLEKELEEARRELLREDGERYRILMRRLRTWTGSGYWEVSPTHLRQIIRTVHLWTSMSGL